jgi:hypothetical protein
VELLIIVSQFSAVAIFIRNPCLEEVFETRVLYFFFQCWIFTVINFVNIIHRSNIYLERRFGDCILSPFSGKEYYSVLPKIVPIFGWSPVSETSFHIQIRTLDDAQKIENFINIASSRTFGSYWTLGWIVSTRRGAPSWLRQHATSRKVAGSIPYEVIGFFQLT